VANDQTINTSTTQMDDVCYTLMRKVPVVADVGFVVSVLTVLTPVGVVKGVDVIVVTVDSDSVVPVVGDSVVNAVGVVVLSGT